MLVQFNFKNHKSFRDETTLDMTATKITEHSDRIITVGKEKLLRVAVIYGANASGKSNVCDAFDYMTYYVLRSFTFGDNNKKDTAENYIKPIPFNFDSNNDSISKYEIYFTIPGDETVKIYNYGFSVNDEGVIEEWLNTKSGQRNHTTSVFYRNTATGELIFNGKSSLKWDNIKESLEKEVLIISLGAKLKIDICKNIRNWFLNNSIINYGNLFELIIHENKLPKKFVTDDNVKNEMLKFLYTLDNSIKGFEVEKIPGIDKNKSDKYRVYTNHSVLGSSEMRKIPLENESAGTLKMFSLYQPLKDILMEGGVFFIDELNARLHPLIVRMFILNFLNPEINKNNAQLIFTCHETWLIANGLLRRDEIWFTEKDKDGISILYSLTDFIDKNGEKIRKDENYEKNYLSGKYGAIPELNFLNLLEQ